ncbi:hypothetical protein A4X13_0g8669 [Tilletia indica]|uniref:Uncharacterized protein n=1 Tax=Tilletia indica TaxID=43049 RepID=A0A8T8SE77_9BASI|nr:hypothetical protein A4X13_0g8669 [Tilletia indica]
MLTHLSIVYCCFSGSSHFCEDGFSKSRNEHLPAELGQYVERTDRSWSISSAYRVSPWLSLDPYWLRFIYLLAGLLTDYTRGRGQSKKASEAGVASLRPGHQSFLRLPAFHQPLDNTSSALLQFPRRSSKIFHHSSQEASSLASNLQETYTHTRKQTDSCGREDAKETLPKLHTQAGIAITYTFTLVQQHSQSTHKHI